MDQTQLDKMNTQELYNLVVRIIKILEQKEVEKPLTIEAINNQQYVKYEVNNVPFKAHYDHDRFDPLTKEWSRRDDEE